MAKNGLWQESSSMARLGEWAPLLALANGCSRMAFVGHPFRSCLRHAKLERQYKAITSYSNVHLVSWRHHAHSIHEYKYDWNVHATDNGRGGHCGY